MTLFLLFNHTLTPEQETDARQSMGVSQIEPLPADLQTLWSQVPPELPDLHAYLSPISAWLLDRSQPGDLALVQGDYGATFLMVQTCLAAGLIPVYGTTARQTVEVPQSDGSIRIERLFRHRMFRRYASVLS